MSALPPPAILSFAPILYAQCLLLHPYFSHSTSLFFRRALAIPTTYLAFTAPLKYHVEPREEWRMLNVGICMVCVYCGWKALEWGLDTDRKAYEWVGLDRMQKMRKENGPSGLDGTEKTEENGAREEYSIMGVLVDTTHLFTSMRGIGYRFSIPVRPDRANWRPSRLVFLTESVGKALRYQTALVVCASIVTFPLSRRMELVPAILPVFALQTHRKEILVAATTFISWALIAFFTISLCYTLFSIFALLVHTFVGQFKTLRPFDGKEYTPLAQNFGRPTSIERQWGKDWHQLFRRNFVFLGYEPLRRLGENLGGKEFGRCLGTMAVFAMSAAAHEYAFYTATRGLANPFPRSTFAEKYGATIFSFMMGVGIICERTFTRMTGVRVTGFFGWVWAGGFIGSLLPLLYFSGAGLEFTKSIPSIDEGWEWWRWLLPFGWIVPR